jgi:acyl carrier protein
MHQSVAEYNQQYPGVVGPNISFISETTMSETNQELQTEVAGLIVRALNFDISPDEIQPDAPLYGEGLGLDSIDILEVALVVSKRYGFQLRSDNADNIQIFSSLASLTRHIAEHRST